MSALGADLNLQSDLTMPRCDLRCGCPPTQ